MEIKKTRLSLIELEVLIKYLFFSNQIKELSCREIVELLGERGFETIEEEVFLLYEPELLELEQYNIIMAKTKNTQKSYKLDENTGHFFDEEFEDACLMEDSLYFEDFNNIDTSEYIDLDIEEEDFNY